MANLRGIKKLSRPAQNVNLVVCAMRNLGDENGCTVGNIVGYLSDCCERVAPKREVVAALKRSIEFGIVDRKRGRYFLSGNDKRLSQFGDGNSGIGSTRSRGNRRMTGINTRSGGGGGSIGANNSGNSGSDNVNGSGNGGGNNSGSGNSGTVSTELRERDIRNRKIGKSRNDRKSKTAVRRRKGNKKSSRRKSIKKTRFARSLKSCQLSDYYQNPSYKASVASSVDSMEYYEGEDSEK